MKKKKYLLPFLAVCIVLLLGACSDWGETDLAAGNQVYPSLKHVKLMNFETTPTPEEVQRMAYSGGEIPEVVEDEERGNVFHLESGYARMSNPLLDVKVQNAVSLTMWVKQIPTIDGDTGVELQDLLGALFSFQNENHLNRMFFTANGWLSYNGVNGICEENNPTVAKTGMMGTGEWHYVAICVHNDGYFVYVDGMKKIDFYSTNFDFSNIVQFMNNVPYFYLGYGSGEQTGEWYIDDLNFYRNKITEKEWKRPGSGGDEESQYLNLGPKDCSAPWWTVFSPILSAYGDCLFNYHFINHTKGAELYQNWSLALTNGKAVGEEGYTEYMILRADAFGWGDYFDASNLTTDINFDTFKEDMQGAEVELTISRQGTHLEIKAVMKKRSGGTINLSYRHENFETTTLGTFLTVDAAHLEIDKYATTVGTLYKPGSYRVGLEDCTTPWWTEYFSKVVRAEGNNLVNIKFKNYTNRATNWNNWVLVTTDGKAVGEESVTEYFVLRSDAFGWGDKYIGTNITHNFNLETFPVDMDGATVDLTTKRIGGRYDMDATIYKAAGGTMEYHYFYENFPTTSIGTILTIEGGYLDILSVSTAPLINQK
ncbi:MAG: hypothetical protein ACRCY5_01265 [Phocaeicola sp.]